MERSAYSEPSEGTGSVPHGTTTLVQRREGRHRTTEQLSLLPSLLPLPWSPLTASADFWGPQQWAQVGVCLLWPHRPAARKEAHRKRLHSVGIYPPGLSGYFQERCTKNRSRHGKGGWNPLFYHIANNLRCIRLRTWGRNTSTKVSFFPLCGRVKREPINKEIFLDLQ